MLKTNQAIVTAALEKLLAHIPSTSSTLSLSHPKLEEADGFTPIQLDSIKNGESPILNDQQFVAENFSQFAIKEDLDLKVNYAVE